LKIKVPTKTVPLVLIAICVSAFGMLIIYLGFFQDDWHHVYYGFSRGLSGLWELFLFDNRPFASFVYYIGFSILGYKPLHWHILALLLRTLTVIFVWLTFCDIWPHHKREATWVSILFAVYPFFKLQPLAVSYTIHWLGYLLYTISIWAMVQSIRKTRGYWLFTILSLLTNGLHLILIEYFAGIELIRPFIIWLLLPDEGASFMKRFRKVTKLWAPYLLVYIAFVIYRVFFIPRPASGYERNAPRLIFALIEEPIGASTRLIEAILKDLTVILYSAWNNAITPNLFEITRPANLISIIVSVLIGCALFFYLRNLRFEEDNNYKKNQKWIKSAFLMGILLTLLGPLPGWMTTQFITSKNPLWSDRFGLAAMIGASLLVVAMLEALINNKTYRLILFCLLIGFSISFHLLNSNNYRWAWVKQSNFYHQLYWRAPYIEPKTAVLSDGEIFPRMGGYPTSFALSTLYPKLDDSREINYWFFRLYKHFNNEREDIISGMKIEDSQYSSYFSSSSLDSLVIFFEPENNQCLWVLRPEDQEIRILPEITREIVVVSNLERIKIDSPFERPIPTQIFGDENKETWCYYYQKGDLARQFADWKQVTELWKEASEKDYRPGNGVEYLPFIEGIARTGEWETAENMTYRAKRLTQGMVPILCSTWERIEDETQSNESRDMTLTDIKNKLGCQ